MDELSAINAELDALNAKKARIVAALRAEEAARNEANAAKSGTRVLAPRSPSPKRTKVEPDLRHEYKPFRGSKQPMAKKEVVKDLLTAKKPNAPSKLMSSLDATRVGFRASEERRAITKSSGFTDRTHRLDSKKTAASHQHSQGHHRKPDPPIASTSRANIPITSHEQSEQGSSPPPRQAMYDQPRRERDDQLRVVEDLRPGPRDFKPNPDDPEWLYMEPNSGIRLKSRLLPHADLQAHLSDRYHLTPSLVYSMVRPGRSGGDLEVPVVGDWIIIGVLAEKSAIRMCGGHGAAAAATKKLRAGADDEIKLEGQMGDEADIKPSATTRQAKRYVTFKLLDLRDRNAGGGDGILNLTLFQADSSSVSLNDDDDYDDVLSNGVRVRKEHHEEEKRNEYRGGSGGAYERFWKESNGAVVAILNPKIMRQRPANEHYQSSNTLLTLTPGSADSIIVIGRAKDLAHCSALKRDGQQCNAWCDRRVNNVCEWHVQQAIQKRRAGRSELMAGTSGIKLATVPSRTKRSAAAVTCDPDTKTGLLPANNRQHVDGVRSYVFSGPSAGPRGPDSSRRGSIHPQFETASAAARQIDPKELAKRRKQEERGLRKRLRKDDGKTLGAKYLLKTTAKDRVDHDEVPIRHSKRSRDESTPPGDSPPAEVDIKPKQRAFDAAAIRLLGFDPTRIDQSLAHDNEDEASKQRRLETITVLDGRGGARPAPKLSMPRGGDRRRSGVRVPHELREPGEAGSADDVADPSSDGDELVIEGPHHSAQAPKPKAPTARAPTLVRPSKPLPTDSSSSVADEAEFPPRPRAKRPAATHDHDDPDAPTPPRWRPKKLRRRTGMVSVSADIMHKADVTALLAKFRQAD